jgi:hypothetical protein
MDNKRIEMLAGLIEEDDFDDTRDHVVESYEKQLEDDVEMFSENVSVIESDEDRFLELIGETKDPEAWEGEIEKEKPMTSLEEGMMLGLVGAGVMGPANKGTAQYESHRGSDGWNDIDIDALSAGGSAMGGYGMGFRDSGYEPPVFEGEMLDWALGEGPAQEISEVERFRALADDQMIEKEERFQAMLNNGEFAVQGGIGPGFEAYDGVQREHVNPFKNTDDTMSKWYMQEGPEDPKWNWKANEPSKESLSEMGEFDKEGNDLPGELMDDDLQIHKGMLVRSVGQVYRQQGGKDYYPVKIPAGAEGQVVTADDHTITVVFDEPEGNVIQWTGPDKEDLFWRDVTKVEPAINKSRDSLSEALEGKTEGDAWPHRRTGQTDGNYIRFKDWGAKSGYDSGATDPEQMHPSVPAEPGGLARANLQNSEMDGHPSGYTVYENDPTYIKMKKKSEDPLDLAEVDAVEEVYKKFFEKYSVYGKKLKESKELNESIWDYQFLLIEYKNPILGRYQSFAEYLASEYPGLDEKAYVAGIAQDMSEAGNLGSDEVSDQLDIIEQVMQLAQKDGNIPVFIALKKAAESLKGMMPQEEEEPIQLNRNDRRNEFVQRIRELADSAEQNYNPKQMSRDMNAITQRYLGKSSASIAKVLTKSERAQLADVRYNLKMAHRRGDAAMEAWGRFENAMRELAGMIEAGNPPPVPQPKKRGRRKKQKILPTVQPSQREKREEPQEEMSLYEIFGLIDEALENINE